MTHLPQIAAQAEAHYLVEKHPDGSRSRTAIRRLSGEERIEELARMLGGLEITPKVRSLAEEMLSRARSTTRGSARVRRGRASSLKPNPESV
ncbi:MAG: hypothetical protein HC923_02065 [Myxococcales bacterium]|nr:hypothetical protein [Myxococcales bacterium]